MSNEYPGKPVYNWKGLTKHTQNCEYPTFEVWNTPIWRRRALYPSHSSNTKPPLSSPLDHFYSNPPTSNAQPFCFLIYCLKLKALAECITKVFSSHRARDPNLNQYSEWNWCESFWRDICARKTFLIAVWVIINYLLVS